MSDLTLEDLPLEERRALPHNHPLLNEYADRMSEKIGMPGFITALKNAGEQSESQGAMSLSPKGAQGVMQFIPGTAKRYGLTDPSDPLASIDAAGRYTADNMKLLNTQDPGLLAAAYNAGENRKDIKSGRVPNIPETKNYVGRVNKYMGDQLSAADVPSDALSIEDLPPGVQRTINVGNVKKGVALSNPAQGGNTPLRVWNPFGKDLEVPSTEGINNTFAGLGKFMTDTVTGTGQVIKDTGNWAGGKLGSGPIFKNDGRNDVAETEARDAPLMDTKAGMGGYLGGALLSTAIPGTQLGKSWLATKAASYLPGALKTLAPLSLTGASLSALAPVSNDGERTRNAEIGAAAGPLATVLGSTALGAGKWVGNKAGQTVVGRDVADGAKTIWNALPDMPNIPGLIGKSFNRSLPPEQAQMVNTAMDAGVPIYASQLRSPKSSLSGGRTSGQREALDSAIAKSFGEDTSNLTTAFPAAASRLSDTYNKLLDNKTIPLGWDHVADLKALAQYNTARMPRFAPSAQLDDQIQRATAAAMSGQPMSGRDYQNIMREYKGIANSMAHRTENSPADLYGARGVTQLMDSLERQATKTMSPEEMALFRKTNREWRNMSQLEPLLPKDVNGNINPKALASLLARKRADEYIYGKGDQYLPDLSKFGNTFMDLSGQPSRGWIAGTKHKLSQAAPFMIGSGAEGMVVGSQLPQADEGSGLIMKGLPYAAGIGGSMVLNSMIAKGMNPRLRPSDLKIPQGALGELFRRAEPGTAAAITLNAAGRGNE